MKLPSIIFFFILVIGIVSAVLYNVLKKTQDIYSDEVGKTPILSLRTAGKFGFIRYKGPIIRINLYDDFIVISGRSVVKIDYKDLSFKRSSYYFFNKALLVMEKSKEHPAEIYLIPPDNKEFYEILLKKGVKILE